MAAVVQLSNLGGFALAGPFGDTPPMSATRSGCEVPTRMKLRTWWAQYGGVVGAVAGGIAGGITAARRDAPVGSGALVGTLAGVGVWGLGVAVSLATLPDAVEEVEAACAGRGVL